MKTKRLAMVLSPLLALALVLSLVAVLVPATPAQAQVPGNLEWAPMYLDGTDNKIVMTNCPETVAFDWNDGSPRLATNVYEGDSNVCFTVTFQNLDTVDHDLTFRWRAGDITFVWVIMGVTLSGDTLTVTIPAGSSLDVAFCCDLSDTATYPAVPVDDWYDFYRARFRIGFDGTPATRMAFAVCVLPTDGSVPVVPTVWLESVDLATPASHYEVRNMRIWAQVSGPDSFDWLEDVYYWDTFWDDCYLYDVFDETACAWEWFTWNSSEMNILPDGSVQFIDHCTLTGGLSGVTWDRTWYFTHDDPWVQVSDTYTGSSPDSFSISTYVDNWADDGTAIRVPGVYDNWTMDRYGGFAIFADQMTAPVIFHSSAPAWYPTRAPGAFGGIVFSEVPCYNSGGGTYGVEPWAQQGVAILFGWHDEHYFYNRIDLAAGESKTLDTWYLFTGSHPASSPSAEEQLYDAVYSLLSWPATAISLSPDQGVGAFTIEGEGFIWNSDLIITWDGTPIAGATSTGWDGKFSTVVPVPDQTTPGTYTVEASDGTNSASATFTVPDMTGPTGATGPQGPSAPGGVASAWLLLPILLAGLGIGIAVWAMVRRRKEEERKEEEEERKEEEEGRKAE